MNCTICYRMFSSITLTLEGLQKEGPYAIGAKSQPRLPLAIRMLSLNLRHAWASKQSLRGPLIVLVAPAGRQMLRTKTSEIQYSIMGGRARYTIPFARSVRVSLEAQICNQAFSSLCLHRIRNDGSCSRSLCPKLACNCLTG